jgi:energy-coupling factor transporter transmembrane protein EcfT
VPEADDLKSILMSTIASGDLGNYMGDLATCWWVLLVLGFISAFLGFVYLVLLRWFAKPLLYISFVLIFGLLVGGGFYVYFLANNYDTADHTY